ncbi:GNAT family N-acetyltransferase [Chitinimonas lacunae]|uniref:GNAT family N-acetyltransferase n=1 Tax=Chitinimonas lacunae TaxID=1963018 RepID=A0ABV8MUR5_9NEIS
MRLRFEKIDLAHFSVCVQFRTDSYQCSFGSTMGLAEEMGPDGQRYREKIELRGRDARWGYYHVWQGDEIIGQLEFRSYSEQQEGWGYVHLFYLAPAFRGRGLFPTLQDFVTDALRAQRCRGAFLSVSPTNTRALRCYQKHGWRFFDDSPKRPGSAIFCYEFPA